MATLRLTPTAWSTMPSAISHTKSNITFTNMDNTLANTDNASYGTVTLPTANTSVNVYFSGYDLSQLSDGKIVDSISVKVKVQSSGPYQYAYAFIYNIDGDGRTYSSSSGSQYSDTVSIITLDKNLEYGGGYTATFDIDTLNNSDNFGVCCYASRSSGSVNTQMMYVYGSEIEIEYHMPPKIFNLILPRG